jgi:AraC family transcriptional regulator
MTDSGLVMIHPGRHVLAGKHAEPSFSSAAKGWRGVMLELFTVGTSDFTGLFENHGIRVHLNGCVNLYQQFEGKAAHTQMRRGNIVVSPAGVPKKFQHKGGGDFLVVHVAPDLLRRLAADMNQVEPGRVELLHNFCTRDVQIERLAQQLWDEYRTEDLASGICVEALANQLGVHLLRHYSTLGKRSQPSPSRLSHKTLKRAIDYIEANLASDLTIREVARAVSLSAGHFAHAFKSTMNIAPHHYVIERRVELAKVLLRDTDLPIENVATLAGFSTHSHFCVTFQRLAGETPSAYRRKQ